MKEPLKETCSINYILIVCSGDPHKKHHHLTKVPKETKGNLISCVKKTNCHHKKVIKKKKFHGHRVLCIPFPAFC